MGGQVEVKEDICGEDEAQEWMIPRLSVRVKKAMLESSNAGEGGFWRLQRPSNKD